MYRLLTISETQSELNMRLVDIAKLCAGSEPDFRQKCETGLAVDRVLHGCGAIIVAMMACQPYGLLQLADNLLISTTKKIW